MSGCADHVSLEITRAVIVAGDSSTWTLVGVLPDCLAIAILNDLDAGGVELWFSSKQGDTAPTTQAAHLILAAGEPYFANYKNIGHIFGSCDVYVRSRAVEPATGSVRIHGVKRAPLKFRG